jgi:hypothetical protein
VTQDFLDARFDLQGVLVDAPQEQGALVFGQGKTDSQIRFPAAASPP